MTEMVFGGLKNHRAGHKATTWSLSFYIPSVSSIHKFGYYLNIV